MILCLQFSFEKVFSSSTVNASDGYTSLHRDYSQDMDLFKFIKQGKNNTTKVNRYTYGYSERNGNDIKFLHEGINGPNLVVTAEYVLDPDSGKITETLFRLSGEQWSTRTYALDSNGTLTFTSLDKVTTNQGPPHQQSIIEKAYRDGSYDIIWNGKLDRKRHQPPGYHYPPNRPVCLSSNTKIATPVGEILVKNLRIGMKVWTLNKRGERVPAPIVRLSGTSVPVTHKMVHVSLADGREVWVSPGHPISDGRHIEELRIGDLLDRYVITGTELVDYWDLKTYDLLPAGDTRIYWANGIPLMSTLRVP